MPKDLTNDGSVKHASPHLRSSSCLVHAKIHPTWACARAHMDGGNVKLTEYIYKYLNGKWKFHNVSETFNAVTNIIFALLKLCYALEFCLNNLLIWVPKSIHTACNCETRQSLLLSMKMFASLTCINWRATSTCGKSFETVKTLHFTIA